MYESLLAQTLRDFEWIVVDNASTDGTAELLARWCEAAPFPIRYFRRETNAGALASLNLALAHASGTLFLYTRDADTIVPTALERFKLHWDAIPPDSREHFVGISVNCVDQNGRLIGTPFPQPYLDSDAIEIRHRYRVKGEKFGFQRTDIMRAYMIPAVPGYVGYMPEGIMWRRIASKYRTRFVNETLRAWRLDQTTASRLRGATGPMRSGLSSTRQTHFDWRSAGSLAHRYGFSILRSSTRVAAFTWEDRCPGSGATCRARARVPSGCRGFPSAGGCTGPTIGEDAARTNHARATRSDMHRLEVGENAMNPSRPMPFPATWHASGSQHGTGRGSN